MKFMLEESKKLSEDVFDYDENSAEDRILYDAISTHLADTFCPAFGINIEVVSQFSRFEDIMLSLVRMVKQGKDGVKEESTKLTLKEDFNPNFPEWIIQGLKSQIKGRDTDLKRSLVKKHIDLANATFIEALPPQSNRDPVLKDPNRLAVFHIRDEAGHTYLYTPDGQCDPYVSVSADPWEMKDASQCSWKWILDHTMDYGYFDMSNPDTTAADLRSDRADAKKGMVTRGRGQYSYTNPDGKIIWLQNKGEDKSGYKLDPHKYSSMLDKVGLNNYAKRLETYYNKIEEIRSNIIEIMSSADIMATDYRTNASFGNGIMSDIRSAVDSLDRAIQEYRSIQKSLDRYVEKDPDEFLAKNNYSLDDVISDIFKWDGPRLREYLKDAMNTIKYIKSNPVIPQVEN